MEQILIIQPTLPQAPQLPGGASDEQSNFSSHLDTAVNDVSSTDLPEKIKTPQNDIPAEIVDSKIDTEASEQDNTQTQGFPGLLQINIRTATTFNKTTQSSDIKTAVEDVLSRLSLTDTDQADPLNLDKIVDSLSSSIKQNFPKSEIHSIIQEAIQPYSQKKSGASDSETVQNKPLDFGKDQIISQLQKIIDNSSEAGKISITHSTTFTSSYAATRNREQLQYPSTTGQQFLVNSKSDTTSTTITVANYMAPDDSSLTNTENKQKQELTGVRIDTKQQFYDAKIGSQENGSNTKSNQGGTENGDTLGQAGQQSGSTQQLSNTNSDLPNTFAQVATGVQETPGLPTTEAVKPVIPFTNSLVHEQEVLQQLVDKFQVNIRKPETNLSIKLHPAELGELKIDLTVKEGSIRANVLAQSQHVQEILERNLTRLKTVLEDQGFTVHEILIASKSDAVGEFDLFDSHLFDGQDDTSAPPNNTQNPTTPFLAEDIEFSDSATTSGVNVTA